eukprot:7081760-Pyramimonas_sp.AAC.1
MGREHHPTVSRRRGCSGFHQDRRGRAQSQGIGSNDSTAWFRASTPRTRPTGRRRTGLLQV